MTLVRRTRFETPADVSIERSDANLFAHVDIDVTIRPGDRVRLHGDQIHVPFGGKAHFTRTATVERAPLIVRAWTRFAGHFGLTHLYEVSFSGRRLP